MPVKCLIQYCHCKVGHLNTGIKIDIKTIEAIKNQTTTGINAFVKLTVLVQV